MSISDYMMPFLKVIEWSREYEITIGGISFTFFDFWIYVFIASIVIGFIVKMLHER